MALTPEQLAEIQRLKALMQPLATEAQRKAQAQWNAEQMANRQGKKNGGLSKFLKGSKEKRKLYHATFANIRKFDPKAPKLTDQDTGAHFFTPDVDFANQHIGTQGHHEPLDQMHYEQGANIMPVVVHAKHPWDYENPKHVDALHQTLMAHPQLGEEFAPSRNRLASGDWSAIEDPAVQEAIKKLGHDAFYTEEGGVKNIGIYNRRHVKSLHGNRGTYDRRSPDITKADGGSMDLDAMRLALMNKPKHFAHGGSEARNWAPGHEKRLQNALRQVMFREPALIKGVDTAGEMLEHIKKTTGPEHMDDQLSQEIQRLEKRHAINQWLERNFGNYVKKQMATETDPVRLQAEQGISGFPVAADPSYWARKGETRRKITGGKQMGQSDVAKHWENKTDAMIEAEKAQEHQDMMHLAPGMYSEKDEWIKKLDPETKLWSLTEHFDPRDLGMDHIRDVLHEDLVSGRIRPEQLNKISMAQAIKRAHEYDQEMEKRRQETAIQTTNNMPTVHDYPESGMKWIELAAPDGDKFEESIRHLESNPKEWQKAVEEFRSNRDKNLEEALKYEGDTMGHCVGGAGYCEKVKRGQARIFSLRDAKGEPHVTIETAKHPIKSWDDVTEALGQEKANELWNKFQIHGDDFDEFMKEQNIKPHESIVQIKGKGNRKPHSKYIPHVQHFVKSGDWSHIGDYENTDLIQVNKGKHATKEEVEALGRHHYPEHNMPAENVLMHYDRMRGMPEMQNEATKNFIADMESGNYRMPPPDAGIIKKALGGAVQPSLEQMRMALMSANKAVPNMNDMRQVGANEAPGMDIKAYMPASKDGQGQLPVGGVDMNPMQPGQQLLPANMAQQQPQGGMPPQGGMQQPSMAPAPLGGGMPPPPPQGGSNILQMTPQGQAMAAMKPQGMADGGGVLDQSVGTDHSPSVPQMTQGGITHLDLDDTQQLANGGQVMGYKDRGYVHHTDINPHPKAGKRFVSEQLPGLMPERPVNMEDLYNDRASLQLRPWDSTSRNVKVTNVSGHDLTEPLITEGGQGFARDIALNKEGISGASGKEIQGRIQSRANAAHEENIKQGGRGHTYDIIANMDKVAPLFTNMPLHIQLDLLKQANLSPKELEHILHRVRSKKVQKKTPFTKMLPLDHPESMKQLTEVGALRKALSEELASKTNQKLLDYNLEDLLGAVTDPHIHAAPAGYAGNTFIANVPHAGLGPKRHSVYDTSGYGEYAGKGAQVPAELYMADTFERVSRDLQKQFPKAGASAIRAMTIGALQTRKGNISQMVNDRVMKNIERFNEGVKKGNIQNPNDLYGVLGHFYKEYGGYKKGGAVKKAKSSKVKIHDSMDTINLELSNKRKKAK